MKPSANRYCDARQKPSGWPAALLVIGAGCGMWRADPASERPSVPERVIAPWVAADLLVCLDGACSEALALRVQSADVRYADNRFQVVAALDGSLYTGVLEPEWRLSLTSPPLLAPTQGWQSSGLVDPDVFSDPSGLLVVYGVNDGSAIGTARIVGAVATDSSFPLFTAVGLGRPRIDSPTGSPTPDGVALGLTLGSDFALASGSAIDALSIPEIALTAAGLEQPTWRQVGNLGGADLILTDDGILGVFFSADGKESQDHPGLPAPLNASIGYAASLDAHTFAPFSGNPVHDHIESFIYHDGETVPAVAAGPDNAVMLYVQTAQSGSRLAIAVHDR